MIYKHLRLFSLYVAAFALSFYTLSLTAYADTIPSSPDTIPAAGPIPYQIEEITFALERTEQALVDVKLQEASDRILDNTNKALQDITSELHSEYLSFRKKGETLYPRFYLENSLYFWKAYQLELQGLHDRVNDVVESNEAYADNLESTNLKWEITARDTNMISKSGELWLKISLLLNSLDNTKKEIESKTTDLVLLQMRIAQEMSFCGSMIDNIQQKQEEIRNDYFSPEKPPLFSTRLVQDEYSPLRQKWATIWNESGKYLKIFGASANIWWILVFFICCTLLIIGMRFGFLKFASIADQDAKRTVIIRHVLVNHPVISVATLFIVNFALLFPLHPVIVDKISMFVLFFGARYLILEKDHSHISRMHVHLTLLLALDYIHVIFWHLGDLSRYLIMLESILGMILMYPYLKPAFRKELQLAEDTFIRKMGIVPVFVFSFYLLSLIANFLGMFYLTHFLIKLGINIPAMAIILSGFFKVWMGLAGAILLISKNLKSQYLSHYWEKLENRVTKLVLLIAVGFWIYYITLLLEIDKPIFGWLIDFLTRERTVGTLHLTVSSIMSFIAILLITFLLTWIIRFIIDEEFINRSKLPRGIPAAISATLRYMIVVFGFMFALSAAGIELGKFSLIVGALGLGIGFGLQNIVNNFISGLILVYERPIQVNDTIEIEGLMGRVKKIGLRSSHVITFDGAEVVVPNSNLISNQLINWTLTDKHRRIEVDASVSYGSDPNIVLKLLEEVARLNENVLKEPSPQALFKGFGESSLDFCLRFWVPFELGIVTKSEITVGIFNIFKEHGIDIPFPQLDLRIKENPG